MLGVWFFIILFIAALTVFLTGFNEYKYTKLRTRAIYSLGVCLFFIFFLFAALPNKLLMLTIGILLGTLLSIPWCLKCRNNIVNNLDGFKYIYKSSKIRNSKIINASILITLATLNIYMSEKMTKIYNKIGWVMFSLCVTWFITQSFALYHIVKVLLQYRHLVFLSLYKL